MTSTDYILLGITAALVAYSAFRNGAKTKKALKIALKQFLNVLPFFVAVFAMIGLFEVLLTPQQIQGWLGSGQGILAPIYAPILGGLATGPLQPFSRWDSTCSLSTRAWRLSRHC